MQNCWAKLRKLIWWYSNEFEVAPVLKNPRVGAGDARDVSSIPGLGGSSGVGNGNSFSILAWKIPLTEEPGWLQSMESQRARHDWACTPTPNGFWNLQFEKHLRHFFCSEPYKMVWNDLRPQVYLRNLHFTLLNSFPRQPTRLPCPWDFPGKNTGVGCHFLLRCMKVKSEGEVAESCATPRDPVDCSRPGSSAHGIFQARVLEWGAIDFSWR